jgi:predicted O-methyltransferase YrrM
MNPLRTAQRLMKNIDDSSQSLVEIREGVANQSDLLNTKLSKIADLMENLVKVQRTQAEISYQLLYMLNARNGEAGEAPLSYDKGALSFQGPPTERTGASASSNFMQAMQIKPLLLDEKTYNTSHPDYDANAVRNFPGKILNYNPACQNVLYKAIAALANGDVVDDNVWKTVLDTAMDEAKTVPGYQQVMDRIGETERYLADLEKKYGAYYKPGWVNMADAIFLYWVIRTLKPKTVVQTGVCNGLSSAFMMLALAKNGEEGHLHVVDMSPIFDGANPAWTEKNRVYGVVVPEGKTSGWLVPDVLAHRFHVHVGDAKKLLPPLVDSLPEIDMFYHDSDHTYNHMMLEFIESKRKLTQGGAIVVDDVAWNAATWDFADQYGVPSYNYKGAVGIAFF